MTAQPAPRIKPYCSSMTSRIGNGCATLLCAAEKCAKGKPTSTGTGLSPVQSAACQPAPIANPGAACAPPPMCPRPAATQPERAAEQGRGGAHLIRCDGHVHGGALAFACAHSRSLSRKGQADRKDGGFNACRVPGRALAGRWCVAQRRAAGSKRRRADLSQGRDHARRGAPDSPRMAWRGGAGAPQHCRAAEQPWRFLLRSCT